MDFWPDKEMKSIKKRNARQNDAIILSNCACVLQEEVQRHGPNLKGRVVLAAKATADQLN